LQELVDDPGTVNKAAESGGWFTKFRVRSDEQTNRSGLISALDPGAEV
jgi:glycine cleavage system H lipoate-binding protein